MHSVEFKMTLKISKKYVSFVKCWKSLALGSAKIHKSHLQVTTKFIKFIWKMQFTNGMKNQCFLLCKNFQKSTWLNHFNKLLMEN